MFQSFEDTAQPEQGPARLADLRQAMAQEGLAGFMIPRADAHQGEYVAPCDERLAWLTGFTGSAGFCIALQNVAGVFVDGRYRAQVRVQVKTEHFAPVHWPETKPGAWLIDNLPTGGKIGFDPWLYTPDQIAELREDLAGTDITLSASENLVDRIWPDRPTPPQGAITPYPSELAGETHGEKRTRLAQDLKALGAASAVITLPDSIAWLLNLRGSDIKRNPIPHAFAVLHDTGQVSLFVDPAKLNETVEAHLGPDIILSGVHEFETYLDSLTGPVLLDGASVPIAVEQRLDAAGATLIWGTDPCVLPKACKNSSEIAATKAAHLRDGAALCRFLAWFDTQAPGTISEIDVVTRLEDERRATNLLLDISFDTIAGSGPHGAIAHYRVSETTNRVLQDGELMVLDGGGQYLDGTTDITRTLPIGSIGTDERAAFTRVLQGMIAMSRVRWPKGLAGRDLDVLARYPLWLADQDYAHGTGHGVGVHLCVHEGPQRLSKVGEVPLEPGMILSNEPGFYREGAFGIRIENLVVVQDASPLPGGSQSNKLCFETISFVPIDRRLINAEWLSQDERAWLDTYHALCLEKIGPLLSGDDLAWLEAATRPL